MPGLGDYFNGSTMRGRANVAKATYATIAMIYLYSRIRRAGKKTAPAVDGQHGGQVVGGHQSVNEGCCGPTVCHPSPLPPPSQCCPSAPPSTHQCPNAAQPPQQPPQQHQCPHHHHQQQQQQQLHQVTPAPPPPQQHQQKTVKKGGKESDYIPCPFDFDDENKTTHEADANDYARH